MSIDVRHWNAKVGDRPGFLDELDAQFEGCDVAVILETGGHRADIVTWARRNGYRIHSGSGEIGASTQILVANDLELLNSGLLDVETDWRGPKGKRIDGREIPWVTVRKGAQALVVVGIHAVWNPLRNWRAHVEFLRELRRFVKARTTVDILLVGDWNWSWRIAGRGSIIALARILRARIVRTGAALDYAVFVGRKRPRPGDGLRPRPALVTGQQGTRQKSDHHSARYNVQEAAP